jgi:hypothetical protein
LTLSVAEAAWCNVHPDAVAQSSFDLDLLPEPPRGPRVMVTSSEGSLVELLLIGELDFVADNKYPRPRVDQVMRGWQLTDPATYVAACIAGFEASG